MDTNEEVHAYSKSGKLNDGDGEGDFNEYDEGKS